MRDEKYGESRVYLNKIHYVNKKIRGFFLRIGKKRVCVEAALQ